MAGALGYGRAINTLKTELGKRQKARITDLPREVLALILCHLTLAHDIAKVAPTSRGLRDAVRHAFVARPFSRAVSTFHRGGSSGNCVLSVAVASDGRVFIGSDNFINVYGLRSLRVKAHADGVTGVAALPDGRFVSVSFDRTVKMWKQDGSLENNIEASLEPASPKAYSLAVLPDGLHFVVGAAFGSTLDAHVEGEVRLYHTNGTLVRTFKSHHRPVRALAVTSDGQHIISGSDDRFVKVWNVARTRCERSYAGHTECVAAVAAMPDNVRILSGGADGIRVWRLDRPKARIGIPDGPCSFHLKSVSAMALVAMPDNQHALFGSSDGRVALFNVDAGIVLRTFSQHEHGNYDVGSHCCVTCLALLPDGLRFVSASYEGPACIAYHGLAPQ